MPSTMDLPTRGGSISPEEVEETLLTYFEDCYDNSEGIDPDHARKIMQTASGPLTFKYPRTDSEDEIPLLHVAAMADASSPPNMRMVVGMLLAAGADPMLKDGDGDTTLGAVISLTQDEDEVTNAETDEKFVHMAAAAALLESPKMRVDREVVASVCSWLRKCMPKCPPADEIIQILRARSSNEEVDSVWSSEELMEYVEDCAYTKKCGVDSKIIQEFLAKGALPTHSQRKASTLLLVVLNPYSSYQELQKVFRLMVDVDYRVLLMRDQFQLSPLQWAADYVSVSRQHDLARPNPAAFLALLPVLFAALPPDVNIADAGVTCMKVVERSVSGYIPKVKPPRPLRFLEGDRVLCLVEDPGMKTSWEEGVIVALWYREGCWPAEFIGAPYEVLLDLGNKVYAPADDDRIIQKEPRPVPMDISPPSAGYGPPATAAPVAPVAPAKPASAKAAAPSRFIRRKREDGRWEMFDTVSGRARPVNSDSESDGD